MARSRFSLLIFGLAALISSIGARAYAQDVPCSQIRSCSTLLQKYELAAAACRAEFAAHRCGEGNRNTEYGAYLRSCAPERMCEEAKWFSTPLAAIPGCTGAIQKSAQDAWAGARACYNAGAIECGKVFFPEFGRQIPRVAWGAVKSVFDFAVEGIGIVSSPVQTAKQNAQDRRILARGWACFNTEGRFKMLCELGGGTFNRVLMGRMMMGGVRGAVTRVVEEPRPVVARRTAVTERARASAGLPSQKARAPIAAIRKRAQTPAIIVAANEFVSPSRPAQPVPEKPKPVRSVAEVRRDEYISRLVGRQNTTVEQRRAFAELAFKAEPKGGTVFLDIQNSKMKYMNDHLKDKNLVTAITNARLKAMFDELHAKYPNLTAQKFEYDDFKSGRFGFKFTDGKIPPGFLDDLRRTMNEAEEKFIAELGEYDVVPKGSDLLPPEKWFASGTGLTPDEANLACRYAARTCQTSVNFRDSRVLKNLGARLNQSEVMRNGAMQALRNTTLTERLPNGQVIPRLEVYEAFRKAESPADFARRINESTGQTITAQTATSVMTYLRSLDEWSTGLLIVEERQSVTFAGSKHNGVTIDVSGMGALNLRELAASMAGETDVMSAMPKARAAERSATEIFERNKAAIVEAARQSLREKGIEAEIRVSGDDIIIRPTNRALDGDSLNAIQDAVAASPSSSNVRISAVGTGVADADNIAVRGEGWEKRVRGDTLRSVTDQSNYTLMVVADAQGKPRLRVAARSGAVPQTVEDAYQNAFREILLEK